MNASRGGVESRLRQVRYAPRPNAMTMASNVNGKRDATLRNATAQRDANTRRHKPMISNTNARERRAAPRQLSSGQPQSPTTCARKKHITNPSLYTTVVRDACEGKDARKSHKDDDDDDSVATAVGQQRHGTRCVHQASPLLFTILSRRPPPLSTPPSAGDDICPPHPNNLPHASPPAPAPHSFLPSTSDYKSPESRTRRN